MSTETRRTGIHPRPAPLARADPLLTLSLMARKHPEPVYAYIRAQATAGVSGSQIWRDLSSGEAGIGDPIRIAKRTVQQLAANYKRAHQDAGDDLEPGAELDRVEAEYRALLIETRRRRRYAESLPASDGQALSLLRECARTLAEIHRFYRSPQKTGRQQQRSEAGRKVEREMTPLERIAKLMREEEEEARRRPASDGLIPLTPSSTGGDVAT